MAAETSFPCLFLTFKVFDLRDRLQSYNISLEHLLFLNNNNNNNNNSVCACCVGLAKLHPSSAILIFNDRVSLHCPVVFSSVVMLSAILVVSRNLYRTEGLFIWLVAFYFFNVILFVLFFWLSRSIVTS